MFPIFIFFALLKYSKIVFKGFLIRVINSFVFFLENYLYILQKKLLTYP